MSVDVKPVPAPMPSFSHLEIVTAPHPALDTPSEPIAVEGGVDASVRLLAVRMIELMHRGVSDGQGGRTRGIGLAANQVNVNRRLIVVDIPGKKAVRELSPRVVTRGPLVMINPEIERKQGELLPMDEGCLSQPGVRLRIVRASEVAVWYTNIRGEREGVFAGGMLARCIQHEVDHLNGITIVERARLQKGGAA